MILANHGIITSSGGLPPSTLLNNLVSVYKAENNANDSLGSYNGTAQGGLIYTSGISGNSFDLNGTNACVELASNALYFPTNVFSISFWAICRASNNFTIISNFDNSTGNKGFYIDTSTTNTITFRFVAFGASGNLGVLSSVGAKLLNTWYNVIITVNGTSAKMYVNGVLESSTLLNNTTIFFNGCKPLIGAYRTTNTGTKSDFKDMKFDELNTWDKVLTTTEITELQTKFYPY